MRKQKSGFPIDMALLKSIPDSTTYEEDFIEVCRAAFPEDLICKLCNEDIISPSLLFVFSCGHHYHTYCATLYYGEKHSSVHCKKCTTHTSQKDQKRLLNMPEWAIRRPFNC